MRGEIDQRLILYDYMPGPKAQTLEPSWLIIHPNGFLTFLQVGIVDERKSLPVQGSKRYAAAKFRGPKMQLVGPRLSHRTS
jgi:hypothetical protein